MLGDAFFYTKAESLAEMFGIDLALAEAMILKENGDADRVALLLEQGEAATDSTMHHGSSAKDSSLVRLLRVSVLCTSSVLAGLELRDLLNLSSTSHENRRRLGSLDIALRDWAEGQDRYSKEFSLQLEKAQRLHMEITLLSCDDVKRFQQSLGFLEDDGPLELKDDGPLELKDSFTLHGLHVSQGWQVSCSACPQHLFEDKLPITLHLSKDPGEVNELQLRLNLRDLKQRWLLSNDRMATHADIVCEAVLLQFVNHLESILLLEQRRIEFCETHKGTGRNLQRQREDRLLRLLGADSQGDSLHLVVRFVKNPSKLLDKVTDLLSESGLKSQAMQRRYSELIPRLHIFGQQLRVLADDWLNFRSNMDQRIGLSLTQNDLEGVACRLERWKYLWHLMSLRPTAGFRCFDVDIFSYNQAGKLAIPGFPILEAFFAYGFEALAELLDMHNLGKPLLLQASLAAENLRRWACGIVIPLEADSLVWKHHSWLVSEDLLARSMSADQLLAGNTSAGSLESSLLIAYIAALQRTHQAWMESRHLAAVVQKMAHDVESSLREKDVQLEAAQISQPGERSAVIHALRKVLNVFNAAVVVLDDWQACSEFFELNCQLRSTQYPQSIRTCMQSHHFREGL